MVGRPSQRASNGREHLPEYREWSGGPSVGPEVVGRPTRKAGSCQEALPEGWERSGGPPGGS